MKHLTLLVLLTALAVVMTWSGYEGVLLMRGRQQLIQEREMAEKSRAAIRIWREKRAVAEREWAGRDSQLAASVVAAAAAAEQEAEIGVWLGKVKRLRALFATHPAHVIPELEMLTELDWLALAHRVDFGHDENGERAAMAEVRSRAKMVLASELSKALGIYREQTSGLLPASVEQLLPYLHPPVSASMLARYHMATTGRAADAGFGALAIVEREPVDVDFDIRTNVQVSGGYGGGSSWRMTSMRDAILGGVRAFRRNNPGKTVEQPADVLPYIQSAEAKGYLAAVAAFQKDHAGAEPKSGEELLPYATDPTTRAQLEQQIKVRQRERGH